MTFGSASTTDEVLDGVDLSGTWVLITGASAGLGVETARAVAAHGANVILGVRDVEKGEAASEAVRAAAQAGGGLVELREVDLASLESVRAFTDAVGADHDRLDTIIANAGVMAVPEGRTTDGFELQFGTNHLGHFVLVNRLRPLFGSGGPARIVNLSSAWPPVQRCRARRRELRGDALRAVAGLRSLEDRERPVRGRARPAGPGRGQRACCGAPRDGPHRTRPTPHPRDARVVADRPRRTSRRSWKESPAGRGDQRVGCLRRATPTRWAAGTARTVASARSSTTRPARPASSPTRSTRDGLDSSGPDPKSSSASRSRTERSASWRPAKFDRWHS